MPSSLTRTSREVVNNPSLFENLILRVMRLTKDGLLVWRTSKNNPNRLVAFPSSEIKSKEDFGFKIGERFAGITVGYPADADREDQYLWLRITDGIGENYYVEYHDASETLKALMKELFALALEKNGTGEKTLLPLYR